MRIEYIRFLNKKPRKAKHCYIKNEDKNDNRSFKKNCDKNRNCKGKWGIRKIVFNKNRVALVAVSLMLVTASYWNYLNKTKLKIAQLGDATFVNSNAVVEEKNEDKDSKEVSIQDVTSQQEVVTQNATSQQGETTQNATSQQEVATQNVISKQEVAKSVEDKENSNYFIKIKLDREKMFSQMIDNYKSIMEDSNIGNEQKKEASNEIKNINKNQNSITTIENLLKGKGFEDAVVLINDNSTNVIIKSDNELKKEQVAQIENIVSRELNIEIEKIHISMHK